jgi:hypothetical protein
MKTLTAHALNPRIDSGARLGYSALDELTFGLGLWIREKTTR